MSDRGAGTLRRSEPTHGDPRLSDWYAEHGRHALAWRADRDRWSVLVSEVMLHQTQVARVEAAWDGFIARFPDPAAMATAGPAAVITAWGRLGYPRRARRLWEAAVHITQHGWPDDLTDLPGVGRYTAGAVRCQADGADVPAVDVNIRRVVERVEGRRAHGAGGGGRERAHRAPAHRPRPPAGAHGSRRARLSPGRARAARRARSTAGARHAARCRTRRAGRVRAGSRAASVSVAAR